MDPGETKTFHIKLTKPGVFPFYCTNFCSALHQEMQGYLVVWQRRPALPGAVFAARQCAQPAATTQPGTDPIVRGWMVSASSVDRRRNFMGKQISNLLRREFRFLHKPLNLWSRLLLLAAAVDDRRVALFSALENASGRAAIFRRTRSLHLSATKSRAAD